MADFSLVSANVKEVWASKYAAEYIRESSLLPYMGEAENSIFRVRTELTGQAGAAIHFPLVQRLKGSGVTGGTVLYGSEDTLNIPSDCIRTSLFRNAVMVTEDQQYKTEIDIYNAGRATLKNWSAEKLRNDIMTELGAVIVKNGAGNGAEDISVPYATATAAQRDLFLDNNLDRILFGNANSNISTTAPAGGAAHSFVNSALAVTAAQTLSAAVLNKAKTLAKKAGSVTGSSHIAPFKSDMTKGQEYFVLFVGSEGFRDLSLDTTIVQANQNARAREGNGMDGNPLFQDGDLMYRGVIIREVPELPSLGAVGASSAVLAMSFLCGQSAIAIGWTKKPNPRTQEFDYGHRHGAAISEIRGQKKVSFNGSQYGVVTLVHAAAPDA